MGLLCENIARRANQEDERKGCFWGTRFKCRECTDLNAILICGIYVDLNLIRAGEEPRLGTSRFSSLFQRIQACGQAADAPDRADGWLGELTWDQAHERDATAAFTSRTGRRASDLGLLPISLKDYVKLLEWTLELLQSGRTTIPADMESMLDRLDIRPEGYLATVAQFEDSFPHAVGSPSSMAAVAERLGVRHIKGMKAARRAFGPEKAASAP